MLRRNVVKWVSIGFSLLLGLPVGADVDNPGPAYITLLSDCGDAGNCYFKVKDQIFQISPDQPPILGCAPGSPDPYPPDCSNVLGSVDAQGNVSLPQNSIVFPPAFIDAGPPVGMIRVDFDPKSDGSGTIDPVGGGNTASLRIRIRLSNPFLMPGCGIGDPDTGIPITVTTGTDGSLTGIAYDQGTGTSQVVNQSFAVPRSSNCGAAGVIVDAQLGLPSDPPNNETVLELQYTPIITGS